MTKKRTERLAVLFEPIASELGYSDRCFLPGVTGAAQACFSRRGVEFTTEALCVGFRSRPQPCLTVEYLGSPHEAADLRLLGLEGNCLAESLFHAQVFLLGRDPVTIAPPTVEVSRPSDWRPAIDRVAPELRDVEPLIWKELGLKWLRLTGRPPRPPRG